MRDLWFFPQTPFLARNVLFPPNIAQSTPARTHLCAERASFWRKFRCGDNTDLSQSKSGGFARLPSRAIQEEDNPVLLETRNRAEAGCLLRNQNPGVHPG